jgi:hypothetical protein
LRRRNSLFAPAHARGRLHQESGHTADSRSTTVSRNLVNF